MASTKCTLGAIELLEALTTDPTRTDSLTWITSYDTLFNVPGVPLYDLKRLGVAGGDPRMLFSWYSGGELCTDPAFAALPPEERANPSMASWPDGTAYIEQQRARLPSGRFRRLHLNLPGSPEGAAFDQAKILGCVVPGRKQLPPEEGCRYTATVDMSGGSSDDAVLCISHMEGRVSVIDLIQKQIGPPPFDPRAAIGQFCATLKTYRVLRVYGDAFAGQTFRNDFMARGISYMVRTASASDLYERLEPVLNAAELELPDHPLTIEQAVTLVWKGPRITHESGSHDDHINAVALAVAVLREQQQQGAVIMPVSITRSNMPAAAPHLGLGVGPTQHWAATIQCGDFGVRDFGNRGGV